MSTTITLHDCRSIVFQAHQPRNVGWCTLRITRAVDEVELVLFGLPDDAVARIVDAFGPPKRTIDLPPGASEEGGAA